MTEAVMPVPAFSELPLYRVLCNGGGDTLAYLSVVVRCYRIKRSYYEL